MPPPLQKRKVAMALEHAELLLTQPSLAYFEPPASVLTSASELKFAETELLRVANERSRQWELKCEALASALVASKKRQRARDRDGLAAEADCELENPKKKASPPEQPKVVEVPHESDDEVPPPVYVPVSDPPTPKGCRLFEQISSVLCAYKDGKLVPGPDHIPYDICAELCKDEVSLVLGWSSAEKVKFRPAVVSALRLVYPHKKEAWFSKPFLLDPEGAASYWSKVLARRAEIWTATADRKKAAERVAHKSSLKERIRAKIASRKAMRVASLRPLVKSKNFVYQTPTRTKARDIISSDSETETGFVVDLSGSPMDPTAAAKTVVKLAPGPETFSLVSTCCNTI